MVRMLSPAQIDEHQRLLAELKVLHDRGLTRQQACDALNGQRAISWIKKYWPSKAPSTRVSRTKSEFESCLERLKELRAAGSTISEAIQAFRGEYSEHLVRRHWARLGSAAESGMRTYGHMDVQTKTVLVPYRD